MYVREVYIFDNTRVGKYVKEGHMTVEGGEPQKIQLRHVAFSKSMCRR